MFLPNFLIVGAPKAGTSSLINYLKNSNEVYAISTLNGRELHFFSKNKSFAKGIQWYSSLFDEGRGKKAIGEKSASYMTSKNAPKRIFQQIPEIKLIFILRNPIDRAYSQYRANVQQGLEYLSFEKAIKKESKRIKKCNFFNNIYSYLKRSIYIEQVNNYLQYFSLTQMYFVIYESFKEDPHGELSKLSNFLEIDTSYIKEIDFSRKHHVTRAPKNRLLQLPFAFHRRFVRQYIMNSHLDKFILKLESGNLSEANSKIKESTRKDLNKYFHESNRKLANSINRNLSLWEQ